MIYEFECECGFAFIKVKSVSERHEPVACIECGADVYKRDIPSRLGGIYGAHDWNTQHYNHSLGKVVKSDLHAKKEAKSRGMSEIGDEPLDKLHKKFDNDRAKKLDEAYDISQLTDLGEISTK